MKQALLFARVLALLLALCPGAGEAADAPPLRFGVSARTMVDMNRNDVTAALKVWMQTVAKERGFPFDPDPRVFDRTEDFVAALKRGEIDIASAPSDEFLTLAKAVPMSGFYATQVGGQVGEQYVLLVKKESSWQRLEDLRGARLLILSHPAAGLAPLWLDAELLRAGLPTRERFFGPIARATKVNSVILPVFFGQADACLVTRRGFDVSGELNPQVLKTLRVLATSPLLIPGVGGYRTSIDQASAEKFREATLSLGDSAAGKHLLTLFQTDAFVEMSEIDFAPTRAFLEQHARLMELVAREEAVP